MSKSTGDMFHALMDVGQEVERARVKFPSNAHLLAALVEEVGELAKDLLDKGNCADARAEAMQVACVAVRIMTEGDSDFCGAEKEEGTLNAQRSTLNAQVKAAKAEKSKGGRPKKAAPRTLAENAAVIAEKVSKTTAPVEGVKPEKAAAVCVDCGKEYSKTGPAQKRCKECGVERLRAQKTAWLAEKKNPAATADRLERIKAVDKRLDTIGEAGATGV